MPFLGKTYAYDNGLTKSEVQSMTEDRKRNNKQTFCPICKQEFSEEFNKYQNYLKVRDHCHHTRKYRGVAHNICDLRQDAKKMSVVFHNGSKYDYHSIIK